MNIQYIKKLLDKIYSVSEEKFNNVYTPFEITSKMVDALNYNGVGSLLVLVNLEFIIELKRRNIDLSNVYYTSGCKYKKECVKQLGINENNIFDLQYNNKEIKVTDDMTKKFDYMVGNPPYNPNSLWKKFVLKGIDMLKVDGKMIFIHPDSWRTSTKHSNFFNLLKNNISELHICGYNVFNSAEVSVDWYVYNKLKQEKCIIFYPDTIDTIIIENEIPIVSPTSVEYSIMKKLCTKDDNGLIIRNTGFNLPQHNPNGRYKQCGGNGNGTGWVNGNFVLTDTISEHQYNNKVVITYCGRPRATYFNDDTGVLKGFYWLTDNQSLPILLNSKMMWKILLIFSGEKYKNKGLQLPSTKILKSINFDGLVAKCDNELYKHYGLTDEEISWVEQ